MQLRRWKLEEEERSLEVFEINSGRRAKNQKKMVSAEEEASRELAKPKKQKSKDQAN